MFAALQGNNVDQLEDDGNDDDNHNDNMNVAGDSAMADDDAAAAPAQWRKPVVLQPINEPVRHDPMAGRYEELGFDDQIT